MPRTSPALLILSLAAGGHIACSAENDPGDLDPGRMGEIVAAKLADVAAGSVGEAALEYRIYDLEEIVLTDSVTQESCDAVDERLGQVCAELMAGSEVGSCWYQTVFLYAHEVPRCAVRFTVVPPGWSGTGLPTLYAMDFTGEPLTSPEPDCGDGDVDDGEECDDGNLEAWDGCDPTCKTEPFEGCEAVIESVYAEAGLAAVRADAWKGPRSHLMINTASALRPIDSAACSAAIALGDEVCHALSEQMPFVGYCAPGGELHGDACSIRVSVGFTSRSPDDGVFTTALEGILAFTIQ